MVIVPASANSRALRQQLRPGDSPCGSPCARDSKLAEMARRSTCAFGLTYHESEVDRDEIAVDVVKGLTSAKTSTNRMNIDKIVSYAHACLHSAYKSV